MCIAKIIVYITYFNAWKLEKILYHYKKEGRECTIGPWALRSLLAWSESSRIFILAQNLFIWKRKMKKSTENKEKTDFDLTFRDF